MFLRQSARPPQWRATATATSPDSAGSYSRRPNTSILSEFFHHGRCLRRIQFRSRGDRNLRAGGDLHRLNAQFEAVDLAKVRDLGHEQYDLVLVFLYLQRSLFPALISALKPGGFLVTCSCSYHISEALFLQILAEAANDAHKGVVVAERRTQAQDHPILLTMPETHYLKCLVAKTAE